MPTRAALGTSGEIRRVRALRDRAEREATGLCYVEGIRQVISAIEGGHPIDMVLVDPARLRSDAGWEAVSRAQATGARVVELKTADFERISSRDNPIGLAAVVSWRPLSLEALPQRLDGFYLVTDDIHDPGNLGTLIRTADGAGCQAVIVRGGVDPAHPAALRASLGTAFRFPVCLASSLDELFAWTAARQIATVATTAHADDTVWATELTPPIAVLVGNEGEGLPAEVVARADSKVRIPMRGTANSLNVSVAAGVILYEIARRRAEPTSGRPWKVDRGE